jgi:putative flippase GtrA
MTNSLPPSAGHGRAETIVRYGLAGALNTGATYVLFYALLQIAPYASAYTVAFIAGIGLSYALNARFVFAAPIRLASALAWPLVYLVQYVVGLAVLALLVERFGVVPATAAIIAIVVTIPLTFVLSRRVLAAPRR